MAPNTPQNHDQTAIYDPAAISSATPSNATVSSEAVLDEEPKVDFASLAAFKKAFRQFKRSRKKGAGLIATRYTLKGRPVY